MNRGPRRTSAAGFFFSGGRDGDRGADLDQRVILWGEMWDGFFNVLIDQA
jgi:hypothetical protein